MTEPHDQPTSPHGTDRWGEPVFGDGITTGSHVFVRQPGQPPGERDVFQVAFIGGCPEARDELVAFGWRYDAAAEEWEPYWQSVGPGSVPTRRAWGAPADEAQPERPRCPHCGLPHDLTPSMELACASIRASIRDHHGDEAQPAAETLAAPDVVVVNGVTYQAGPCGKTEPHPPHRGMAEGPVCPGAPAVEGSGS